jgi:hypothetical protein
MILYELLYSTDIQMRRKTFFCVLIHVKRLWKSLGLTAWTYETTLASMKDFREIFYWGFCLNFLQCSGLVYNVTQTTKTVQEVMRAFPGASKIKFSKQWSAKIFQSKLWTVIDHNSITSTLILSHFNFEIILRKGNRPSKKPRYFYISKFMHFNNSSIYSSREYYRYYYYYYYYYLTAIEFSLGGSSPYTSTDKTNKNLYIYI